MDSWKAWKQEIPWSFYLERNVSIGKKQDGENIFFIEFGSTMCQRTAKLFVAVLLSNAICEKVMICY